MNRTAKEYLKRPYARILIPDEEGYSAEFSSSQAASARVIRRARRLQALKRLQRSGLRLVWSKDRAFLSRL